MSSVRITSAVKLTKPQQQEIEKVVAKKYSQQKLEYVYLIDESIIGGLKIMVDGEIYDASLKEYLKQLLAE